MSQTRTLIKTRKSAQGKRTGIELIELQKVELELKEKNITDSLIYAQRIQEALLPSETYFRIHFEDSFIFFKPKNMLVVIFTGLERRTKKFLLWQPTAQVMEYQVL